MIGQEKLKAKVQSLTIDTFPHSILLLGESGSGKKLFINEIINGKLNLPVFDITDRIDLETINDIYTKIEPSIYIIDLRNITIKEENVILKLVEEPLDNIFLVLIENNRNNIIPTILNRCQVWELEPYTIEELKTFLLDKKTITGIDLLDICKTPGDILFCQQNAGKDIVDMATMVDKIINFIGNASYSNVLSISDKIAFKNETDKWNYGVFCRLLKCKIFNIAVNFNNNKHYRLYQETELLMTLNNMPFVNKQYIFEQYLYNIKSIMKRVV